MAKWISLQKTDTGFVFATTHSIKGSQWDWISTVVAEEFECSPDDLDCIEDDYSRNFVSLRGEPLVEIHNCRMVNEPAPLVVLAPLSNAVSDADYRNWRWDHERDYHKNLVVL